MDNPMGGIRRGWQSISEGYLKLFKGPAIVQVTFHDFSSQGGEDWHPFVAARLGLARLRTRGWTSDSDDALVHTTGGCVAPVASSRIDRRARNACCVPEDNSRSGVGRSGMRCWLQNQPMRNHKRLQRTVGRLTTSWNGWGL